MSPTKTAKKSASSSKKSTGLSAEERAAMKERLRELKAEAAKADGEKSLLEKVTEMSQPDRGMAERVHAIVKASAPGLTPKTWYGMPAYANQDGKIVCFFQAAEKFQARYATFGFNDTANLDDGSMWPTSFALKALGPAEEARLTELVKRAVS